MHIHGQPWEFDDEMEVIVGRAHGVTLKALGSKFGVLQERIRQLEAKIARKYRSECYGRPWIHGLDCWLTPQELYSLEKIARCFNKGEEPDYRIYWEQEDAEILMEPLAELRKLGT